MVARCAPRRGARVGVLGVQRAESSGWAARRGPPGAGLAGLRAAVTEVGTAPRRTTRPLPLALRVPRLHCGMPSVLHAASFPEGRITSKRLYARAVAGSRRESQKFVAECRRASSLAALRSIVSATRGSRGARVRHFWWVPLRFLDRDKISLVLLLVVAVPLPVHAVAVAQPVVTNGDPTGRRDDI